MRPLFQSSRRSGDPACPTAPPARRGRSSSAGQQAGREGKAPPAAPAAAPRPWGCTAPLRPSPGPGCRLTARRAAGAPTPLASDRGRPNRNPPSAPGRPCHSPRRPAALGVGLRFRRRRPLHGGGGRDGQGGRRNRRGGGSGFPHPCAGPSMAASDGRRSLEPGPGAPGCGSGSAPPPPLARRRGGSRRGHLGNGDRPGPGYGGRRGTSLRGRRQRRRRGLPPTGWEGRRARVRGSGPGPAAQAPQVAAGETRRVAAVRPGVRGRRRCRRFRSRGCAVGCARPAARRSAGGVHEGPRERLRGLGPAAVHDL